MNVLDFKTRLSEKIHDSSINKVQDFYGLMQEAAGNILLKLDPQETKRVSQIEDAIYDQVFTYIVPSDLKGNRFLDIRPQTNRTPAINVSQTFQKSFDMYKTTMTSTVEFDSGLKTLRVNIPVRPGITLSYGNQLTGEETWTAGGNATDLSLDTVNFVTSNSSLKFDITGGGTEAYLDCAKVTKTDLTVYKNVGALFALVYIPDTTIITSIGLRWGSDASNYYSSTVTSGIASTAFKVGWNLCRFDWAGSTQVGTPVDSAVDFFRVTFNYNGTATTSCRVDSIVARIGSIYELVYYSRYLFRDTTGVWKEKPTSDDDYINLDTESVNLLVYEVALLVAQELSGENASFDTEFFQKKRDEVFGDYMRTYKSEVTKQRVDYYRRKMLRRR